MSFRLNHKNTINTGDINLKSFLTVVENYSDEQAKEGRIHILGEMAKAIEKPQEKISEYAHRWFS